jgi:hypothetical protein
MMKTAAFAAFAATVTVNAIDNGKGRTPPM